MCMILSFSILTSCKKEAKEIEKDFLENAIQQIKLPDNYQWVIVLPDIGCHGCIQEGEFFMKQNITNKKILFVLTNFSSLKILQQKLETHLNEHPNIYIDKEDVFNIPTDNSIYPCIIQVDSGKYIKHSFQSPKMAAFKKLKQQLKSL